MRIIREQCSQLGSVAHASTLAIMTLFKSNRCEPHAVVLPTSYGWRRTAATPSDDDTHILQQHIAYLAMCTHRTLYVAQYSMEMLCTQAIEYRFGRAQWWCAVFVVALMGGRMVVARRCEPLERLHAVRCARSNSWSYIIIVVWRWMWFVRPSCGYGCDPFDTQRHKSSMCYSVCPPNN